MPAVSMLERETLKSSWITLPIVLRVWGLSFVKDISIVFAAPSLLLPSSEFVLALVELSTEKIASMKVSRSPDGM